MVDVERFFTNAHRVSGLDSVIALGFVQYRSALGRLIAESGGDAAVLRFKSEKCQVTAVTQIGATLDA
jgi:hypothetical protein